MRQRRSGSGMVIGFLLVGLGAGVAMAQETPRYGDEVAPKYDMIPMKKYDMVPMNQDTPAAHEAPPGSPEIPRAVDPVPDAAAATPVTPSPAVQPQGERFQGIYFHMEGKTLHKWDFLEDGTFLHQVVAGSGGTGVRNSERGTYAISGGEITLTVTRAATAFSTPGVEEHGRQTSILGGGAAEGGETRKVKFGFVGPKGSAGIILDGIKMAPRKWQ